MLPQGAHRKRPRAQAGEPCLAECVQVDAVQSPDEIRYQNLNQPVTVPEERAIALLQVRHFAGPAP